MFLVATEKVRGAVSLASLNAALSKGQRVPVSEDELNNQDVRICLSRGFVKVIGRKKEKKVVSTTPKAPGTYVVRNERKSPVRLEELGLELAIKPIMNVIGVKMQHPAKVQRELAKLNWFVSKGRYPKCVRFVLMPHVTRAAIDEFLPVFEKVCRASGEL